MTIEEYSERMGYDHLATTEDYQQADFIYMMAGNMDKDDFCKDYKKHRDSILITTLADGVNSRDIFIRQSKAQMTEVAKALMEESQALREIDEECSVADRLDDQAAKLIGRRECIRFKMGKRYFLSDNEREYITTYLR